MPGARDLDSGNQSARSGRDRSQQAGHLAPAGEGVVMSGKIKKAVGKHVGVTAKRNVKASFGQALAALEEFRTMLVDQQPDLPAGEAMAFAAARGAHAISPLGNVHATGVG